jgi:hypothetical protein
VLTSFFICVCLRERTPRVVFSMCVCVFILPVSPFSWPILQRFGYDIRFWEVRGLWFTSRRTVHHHGLKEWLASLQLLLVQRAHGRVCVQRFVPVAVLYQISRNLSQFLRRRSGTIALPSICRLTKKYTEVHIALFPGVREYRFQTKACKSS